MAKIMRKIIEIDEDLCNGCGQCVPSCAEGALVIIDGKARVVQDRYCDGLGACLGECPTGALRIIEREAEDFDEEAAMAHVASRQQASGGCPGSAMQSFGPSGGCPGSGMAVFEPAPVKPSDVGGDKNPSLLEHWPVQIRLVPPDAPFLKGRDLVIAADCAAVAYADFHGDFVGGNAVMMGCPKFDEDYTARLGAIFSQSGIASITVVRMEVPCCNGLADAARCALAASGRDIAYREIVIGRQGAVLPAHMAL